MLIPRYDLFSMSALYVGPPDDIDISGYLYSNCKEPFCIQIETSKTQHKVNAQLAYNYRNSYNFILEFCLWIFLIKTYGGTFSFTVQNNTSSQSELTSKPGPFTPT
jgi:hypothetical protein